MTSFDKAPQTHKLARGFGGAVLVGVTALIAFGQISDDIQGNRDVGTNDHFTVDGKITHIGKHSVGIRVSHIEEAEGDAEKWFQPNGLQQIHDNYGMCDGKIGNLALHTIGYEIDAHGHEITLQQIKVGEKVEAFGEIRASYELCLSNNTGSKGWSQRPVFESLRVEAQ